MKSISWRVWAGLPVGVLALHAALLQEVFADAAPTDEVAVAYGSAMQVRWLASDGVALTGAARTSAVAHGDGSPVLTPLPINPSAGLTPTPVETPAALTPLSIKTSTAQERTALPAATSPLAGPGGVFDPAAIAPLSPSLGKLHPVSALRHAPQADVPAAGVHGALIAASLAEPADPQNPMQAVAAVRSAIPNAVDGDVVAEAKEADDDEAPQSERGGASAAVGASAGHAAAAEPLPHVPTYRTQMPPPLQLNYELRRGMLAGSGTFSWRPSGDSYELLLDGKVAGFSVLSWRSQGGFDAAGLAPVRFTDQRRGKSGLAANFQRGPGVITYSGPSAQFPLLPGAQDRLSWMVQLPAILNANPATAAPGSRISMFVTGARGDGDVWTFRTEGTESVTTPGGTVTALRMLREPRKPHDTRVEVWLDSQRNHIPVRARMSSEPDGDVFELSLR
jgi:hypothetical protein